MAGVTLPIVVVPIAPGATTAGDSISIPSGAPKIGQLVAGVLFAGSDGTNAAAATQLSVVSDASSSGQISKVSATAIKLGDNTTTRDMLIIAYVPEGAAPGF